jgi:hypothetical protein
VSQGGKGQQPFPGAIGLSRVTRAHLRGTSLQCRRGLISEAYRRHPCQRGRFVVRRKAHPLASPVQTHPHGLFTVFRISSRLNRPGFQLVATRTICVVRREDMGIAKLGQGRFSAMFSAPFGPSWPATGARQPGPDSPVVAPLEVLKRPSRLGDNSLQQGRLRHQSGTEAQGDAGSRRAPGAHAIENE